jgi:hypothetical protein
MDMKLTLNTTPTLLDPKRAEALASHLQAGDPDWTYRVEHGPKYSRIEILDEDGEHIGYWTDH